MSINENIHDYARFDSDNDDAAYYFFHIPKTAGTSLYAALEDVFAKEEICPPHLWRDLIRYDKDELKRFRLFRGHFYSYLGAFVTRPLRAFVFLRDPIERCLSHYDHVLREPGHYLHARAKELGSLAAYLKDPVARETVRNFQAKALIQRFNLGDIVKNLDANEAHRFGVERILETTPAALSDASLLEQAGAALDEFCCVGITERFEDSLRLLAFTFGWDISGKAQNLNACPNRVNSQMLTDEERGLLLELNQVDLALYERAGKLFNAKLAMIKPSEQGPEPPVFVSHAQNFEDLMLWRALKHVECGFYIDIGAWSPESDSVTKAFYDRGWAGVNVEPNPEFDRHLREFRPRDKNLCVAVSDRRGSLVMNFLDNPGLSTLDDGIAESHRNAGLGLHRRKVAVTTLADLWREHVPAGQEVHFLKIDVEGQEEPVLRGNDWTNNRPWIIVAEATLPMSQIESHGTWEPILLQNGYRFAYADGINRFYIANERAQLHAAFKYPPNIFDAFRLNGQVRAEARAVEAEARAVQAEARVVQAEARAVQADARADDAMRRAIEAEARADRAEKDAARIEANAAQVEARLSDVLASTSWRASGPLRWMSTGLRSLPILARAAPTRLQPVSRAMLVNASAAVRARPRVRKLVLGVVDQVPGLKLRLIRFVVGQPAGQGEVSGDQWDPPIDVDHLCPRAREIYARLRPQAYSRRHNSQ